MVYCIYAHTYPLTLKQFLQLFADLGSFFRRYFSVFASRSYVSVRFSDRATFTPPEPRQTAISRRAV